MSVRNHVDQNKSRKQWVRPGEVGKDNVIKKKLGKQACSRWRAQRPYHHQNLNLRLEGGHRGRAQIVAIPKPTWYPRRDRCEAEQHLGEQPVGRGLEQGRKRKHGRTCPKDHEDELDLVMDHYDE